MMNADEPGVPGVAGADPGRTVCACFQVGINTLVRAIAEQGLDSPQAIGVALKAGTNCGSCVPELRQILAAAGRAAWETDRFDLEEGNPFGGYAATERGCTSRTSLPGPSSREAHPQPRRARQRQPLLRPDDMHNALVAMAEAIEFNAEGCAVFFQGFHLFTAQFFFDRQVLIKGRHIVIGSSHHLFRTKYFAASFIQSWKSLRTRYFMNKVFVDI